MKKVNRTAGTPDQTRTNRVLKLTARLTLRLLLFLATVVLVAYFAPLLEGIRTPLLALATENLPGVALEFSATTLNPADLGLGVADPVLRTTDGRELVRAESLFIDLDMPSEGEMRAQRLRVKKPRISVFLMPDGSLSLASLVPPKSGKPAGPKSPWSLQNLEVTDGMVDVDLGPDLQAVVGPVTMLGKAGYTQGSDQGQMELRIDRINLKIPEDSPIAMVAAGLGITREQLQTLGPVVGSATWGPGGILVAQADLFLGTTRVTGVFTLRPETANLDIALAVHVEGAPVLTGSLSLAPDKAVGDLLIPGFKISNPAAILPLASLLGLAPEQVLEVGELKFAPLTLKLREPGLDLEWDGLGLESVRLDESRLGDLSLSLGGDLRLGKGTISKAWAEAIRGEPLDPMDLEPAVNLNLKAALARVAQGELKIDPELSLDVQLGFRAPLTLILDHATLTSVFGKAVLAARAEPAGALGIPRVTGDLKILDVNLALLGEKLPVPPPAKKLLQGLLNGRAEFSLNVLTPTDLVLSQCRFETSGSESRLVIKCPEGGTTLDLTQQPGVGPATLFTKKIPWGKGQLLLEMGN